MDREAQRFWWIKLSVKAISAWQRSIPSIVSFSGKIDISKHEVDKVYLWMGYKFFGGLVWFYRTDNEWHSNLLGNEDDNKWLRWIRNTDRFENVLEVYFQLACRGIKDCLLYYLLKCQVRQFKSKILGPPSPNSFLKSILFFNLLFWPHVIICYPSLLNIAT